MKKLLTVLCAGALLLPSVLPAAAVDRSAPVRDSVAVEKINFQNPAFLRGMDVSSVISLEDAGVTFRDERGEEQDLFKILADNGVNAVRVRIWHDPYDSEGHGYGGGNSDLDKAKQIGRRAAAYGMKLLADFHYSDFWADPAKQKEPKAWAGLSAAQKAETIYTYTNDSLKELRAAGADLCMVQIGNEITSGVAGCMDNADRAALLSAASRAVRDFDSEVMIACHFTDPQKTDTIKWFADYLHQYGVDYDVFATSYYPSWHGSLSNLTHVLSYAAETYGKYAMVAETSYPYTLEDSDGHANTVSFWNNNTGDDMRWDFSVQGQADAVRAVADAVNRVPDGRGLGVFYWEGAWITVGDITGKTGSAWTRQYNANRAKWEQYGCGWASSYAAEYDPDDAGQYCGGSAVDNQAFFDPKGQALPSLHVFKTVLTGTVTNSVLSGDVNGDGRVDVNDATQLQRFLAELIPLADERRCAADVDRNGMLTADDVTVLLRYLAEYETDFPIGAVI